MKKSIIISIVMLLVLVVLFYIVSINNKIVSTIYLDINPSIEINLDKNESIISVIALNDSAKDIINDELSGKKLDECLHIITSNVVSNGYADNEIVEIILHSEGMINEDKVESIIEKSFNNEQKTVDIIKVESITKEDEKLAKKYNVSPAKVSYIKSIKEENENIDVEEFMDKSVFELQETKRTGNYCDEGYNLEGDFCYKEINREEISYGNICPNGYEDYKGSCYQIGGYKGSGKYECHDNSSLINNECVETRTYDATVQYSCSKGTLMKKGEVNPIGAKDNDTYYCIDKSTGKEPVLRCLTNSGHIIINGKCYNGPAPTINGSCPNGDVLRNGKCYSLDKYVDYVCPNGQIYSKKEIDLCPDTLTYIKPTITGYICNDDGAVLNGTKCVITNTHPADEIYECEAGFTFIDNRICLDLKNPTQKKEGYYCEGENTKIKGNECIIYEIIDAKHY